MPKGSLLPLALDPDPEVDAVLAAAALVVAGCPLNGSEAVLSPAVACGVASLRSGLPVELVSSSWKTPSRATLQLTAAGGLRWEWAAGGAAEGRLAHAAAHADGRILLRV
eukprot:CAMPEP_0205870744 /NCGR_PEP_ID=MMETSP1083-20121108/10722_1 /ASSEMBLY_ACC=CAM_ASM_000430 /TAXON_ID=97485 /ORGANISM="Prymnesium parvum, Strain Texoma1" /LENGTH=109 /DNA_ID=CAMNT_0053233047 /DNA_START=555 /DNA_END=880 /DNA_ORIENTATION=+